MYHPELYIYIWQLANHSSVNLVILLYTKRGDGSHLDFEQIKTTKVWSYNVHSIVASNDASTTGDGRLLPTSWALSKVSHTRSKLFSVIQAF